MFKLFGKRKIPYSKIAVAIMIHAEQAALRCSAAGSDTEKQFNLSFTEFLAYFAALTGQKIFVNSSPTDAQVKECFDNLIAGFVDTNEPTRQNVEFLVRMMASERVLNEKDWGFKSHLQAYCYGDLDALRVSNHDLAELEQKLINTKEHAPGSLACLVRISRYGNEDGKIPSGVAILGYSQIIEQAMGRFRAELATLLE
jgi:hypothetical protein